MSENKYKPTIGIEVHAELKTETKMFCNSKNDPEEKRPNVNVCPICMGHPGTLPVINKKAVWHVLGVGVAVGGALADYTEFDRKNYFYPDLPKGYQISQYQYPLVSGGELAGVLLTRIHLEEDTARSAHASGEYSLVDFNRAGVPLVELVTEPVVKTAKEASRFAREFQLLLRYLGASDANMEKGEMRVEVNISISPTGGDVQTGTKLGTKVEIKNLNSFKSVEQAIEYEIKRQSKVLNQGERVVQETRGWDENKGKTFSQRLKEESHDYRYFPDPDLPSLSIGEIKEFNKDVLESELPELPWEARKRYQEIGKDTESSEHKIHAEQIEMFVTDERYGKLFDETYKKIPDAYKLIGNYISSDIAGLVAKHGESGLVRITPEGLGELINLYVKGKISSRGAKDILAYMFEKGGNPEEIAKREKLLQESDEASLEKIVREVLKNSASVVVEYKNGKESSMQYLIGQGMKKTKGAANPSVLAKLLKEALD